MSALDVVGYGVVLHLMTSSRVMWCRAMLYFFSRSADCGIQVDGREGRLHDEVDRVLPTDKVSNRQRSSQRGSLEELFSDPEELSATEQRAMSFARW